MVKRYVSDIGSIGSAVEDGWLVSYAEYEALEAKVAVLEKDAARYRWLRDSGGIALSKYGDPVLLWNEEDCDVIVDHAMNREA